MTPKKLGDTSRSAETDTYQNETDIVKDCFLIQGAAIRLSPLRNAAPHTGPLDDSVALRADVLEAMFETFWTSVLLETQDPPARGQNPI